MQHSAFEIWQEIFTYGILEMITNQTNLYANHDKNNPTFKVTVQEIAQFLGILLISDYNSQPEENHYWSTQEDLGVTIVSKTVRRNRFHALKNIFMLRIITIWKRETKWQKYLPSTNF